MRTTVSDSESTTGVLRTLCRAGVYFFGVDSIMEKYLPAIVALLVVVAAVLGHLGFRGREYVIGVDLGTSYSVVAIKRILDRRASVTHEHGGGSPVFVVPDFDSGNVLVPSIVSFFSNGTNIVGEPAESRRIEHPFSTIYHAKRFIGRNYSETVEDAGHHPFSVVPEKEKEEDSRAVFSIPSVGIQSPIEVGKAIISRLRESAERYIGMGYSIEKVVICVPAEFRKEQREATRAVFTGLGLKVMRVLEEPTAAAIAYNLHKIGGGLPGTRRRFVIVFDLGGGTLDVSLLVIHDSGNISVEATAGDAHLGGQDFDQKLAGLLEAKASPACVHEESMNSLLAEAERIKKELTSSQASSGKVGKCWVEVSREEFGSASEALIDRTISPLYEALESQSLGIEEVHDVVLVGGGSRMPIVRDRLKKEFEGTEAKFHDHLDPDLVVAMGAANVLD